MVVRNEKSQGRRRSAQADPEAAEKLSDPAWAWTAYQPDARRPWNLAQAGHLYRRAAFGASWEQLQQALADGPQQAIERLLRPQADVVAFNHAYDEYESPAAGSVDSLRAWWLRRMVETPHPLLEKMTLFWHSHFATSGAKVKNARLMQRHVQLLRGQALGSFRALLQGISCDPAVLISLGAEANRKALPNENLARPLLENFAVGPGHYTEKDVRESARAFTGWFVLRDRLRYIPREHDASVKYILGQKGNFTGDDVVRIVLEQPATSRMLVRRLYRWLISETEEPDADLIAPLVQSFAKDYDVLKLVETMLRSNLFFSEMAYRRRIKCPVEFALSIAKPLEGTIPTTQLAQDLAGLGQNLYYPPTVRGWTGGRNWINSATLVGRHNLAVALLGGSGPYAKKLEPWALANKHGCATPESAACFLLDLFLQSGLEPDDHDALLKTVQAPGPPDGRRAGDADNADPAGLLRRFAHAVVTLPEFHLA